MNKIFLFTLLSISYSFGQSFHPAPGNAGTNAIKRDSSCFIGWATGGSVQRGYVDISDTTVTYNGTNKADYGNIQAACGPATGSVTDIVSLGDSGIVIMTFDHFIMDGPGYDFAVFENGFTDGYMELAHVEVSSDGINYFRFPSTSEIPLSTQLGNASISDCRYVNNLAGKYRVGFGTPFDIAEIPNDPNLDKQAIRYVKLIDVVGTITGPYASVDSNGGIINDPFPTPFGSCGFDLEAIGIIQGYLKIDENEFQSVQLFPNPASTNITIKTDERISFEVYSSDGKLLTKQHNIQEYTIDLSGYEVGIYTIKLHSSNATSVKKFVKN